MKNIIILLLSLCSCDLMTSCDLATKYDITPEAAPYVDAFFDEALARGVNLDRENLIVKFSTDESIVNSSVIGRYKRNTLQRYIYLHRPSFDRHTECGRESILFHELGHWAGLKHDDTAPKLIMNTHQDLYLYCPPYGIDRTSALDYMFNKIR